LQPDQRTTIQQINTAALDNDCLANPSSLKTPASSKEQSQKSSPISAGPSEQLLPKSSPQQRSPWKQPSVNTPSTSPTSSAPSQGTLTWHVKKPPLN
jgi:hypothetical protein